MRNGVAVDDDAAARLKLLCDRRFARAGLARKADDKLLVRRYDAERTSANETVINRKPTPLLRGIRA